MKKTLYLLIVSVLFFGNMGFASALSIVGNVEGDKIDVSIGDSNTGGTSNTVTTTPPTIGRIDGVTEIDIPMEEVPEPCIEADYTYSDWSICHINRTQIRTSEKINARCKGGFVPQFSDLTQTCDLHLGVPEIGIPIEKVPEPCVEADYTYSDWSICHINRTQIRTSEKINARCKGGFVPQFSDLTQTCDLHLGVPEIGIPIEKVPEPCVEADYTYSDWSDCRPDNTQIRTSEKINARCKGGFVPNLIQSCTYSVNIPGGNIGSVISYVAPIVTNPIQQVLGEKITAKRYIKTPNSSTVYLLDTNNIRHAYPQEKIWYSYFDKDFSFVETITEEELATYSLGKNVTFKAGVLMKIPSVPKVYKVADDNGLIQWIKSESTATRLYGENWKTLVQDLSEAFFGDYVLGDDIE